MEGPSAPTPTWTDGVASFLDQPNLAWVHADIPDVVAMARLRSADPLLVLSCSTGLLPLEVIRVQGVNSGRLVGVDNSRGALQQAILKFEALGLDDQIQLVHGSPTNLDGITTFPVSTHPSPHPMFDAIFARHTIPPNADIKDLFQHWSTFLTPTTGRMVVTFNGGDSEVPQLAGIQAVDASGTIRVKMSWALDSDWVEAENHVWTSANAAGLQVVEIRRLTLQGNLAGDIGQYMEEQTQEAFESLSEKEPEWVKIDGTFSPHFKRKYLWESWELSEDSWNARLVEMLGDVGSQGRVQFVPAFVKAGAVLCKSS